MEVLFASVEFGQSSLREAPERFDAIDVSLCLSIHEGLFMIHAHMLVIPHIHEAIVATPFVSGYDTLGINSTEDDGAEGLSSAIRDDLRVHRPSPLEDAEDGLL